jgi:DtxR family Mn-dependent transcriptional regulator
MRKHRLAECLLVQVIGLPWEQVHAEACRWEHVMSQDVERRLLVLLGHPTVSPFGNPIPGLAELGEEAGDAPEGSGGQALAQVAREGQPVRVTVLRIAETLQADEPTMAALCRLGAVPGSEVDVLAGPTGVRVAGEVDLGPKQARQIVVAVA